jgi:hypothetical protein
MAENITFSTGLLKPCALAPMVPLTLPAQAGYTAGITLLLPTSPSLTMAYVPGTITVHGDNSAIDLTMLIGVYEENSDLAIDDSYFSDGKIVSVGAEEIYQQRSEIMNRTIRDGLLRRGKGEYSYSVSWRMGVKLTSTTDTQPELLLNILAQFANSTVERLGFQSSYGFAYGG